MFSSCSSICLDGYIWDTLPKTNISHLKIGLLTQKERIVFQPSIFRCESVSFRGVISHEFQVAPKPLKPSWSQGNSDAGESSNNSHELSVCIPIINYLSEYTWIFMCIYVYIYIFGKNILQFLNASPSHSSSFAYFSFRVSSMESLDKKFMTSFSPKLLHLLKMWFL